MHTLPEQRGGGAEPAERLRAQKSSCSLFYKLGALLRILLGREKKEKDSTTEREGKGGERRAK